MQNEEASLGGLFILHSSFSILHSDSGSLAEQSPHEPLALRVGLGLLRDGGGLWGCGRGLAAPWRRGSAAASRGVLQLGLQLVHLVLQRPIPFEALQLVADLAKEPLEI